MFFVIFIFVCLFSLRPETKLLTQTQQKQQQQQKQQDQRKSTRLGAWTPSTRPTPPNPNPQQQQLQKKRDEKFGNNAKKSFSRFECGGRATTTANRFFLNLLFNLILILLPRNIVVSSFNRSNLVGLLFLFFSI